MHRRGMLVSLLLILGQWLGGANAVAADNLKVAPSPLVTVDMNRATVVDRVVNEWGDRLAASTSGITAAQLRGILSTLRADHLLAASLAGTLDGLRAVIANALTSTVESKPRLLLTKALGDASDDLVYTPVTPCRIVDTRSGGGGVFLAGNQRDWLAHSASGFAGQGGSATDCGIPAGPAAVMLNVTLANTVGGPEFFTLWPFNQARPNASTVNWTASGQQPANAEIVPLCSGNVTCTSDFSAYASGQTQAIIDVVGYFKAPSGPGNYFVQGGNAFGATAVLGTTDSQPLELYVAGGRVMRYEYASGSPNIIGGYAGNAASGGGGRTIAGGGYSGTCSGFLGVRGVICANQTADDFASIGGGFANVATGYGSTIGGGVSNVAGYIAPDATIGLYSTVAGGNLNWAARTYSMVPGGYKNFSDGIASFAAGYQAQAKGNGEFVWADYINAAFEPSNATHGWGIGNAGNTFNVRATGGVWFVTGVDGTFQPTTSVYLNPGSGAWASTSDRAVKENFHVTDPLQILKKVVALPIESWNYIGEGAKVRHLGPVSQDFWAAFALGANDKTITTVDEAGVTLVAIQGLHQLVQEKDARIAALEQQVSELQTLRSELAALKATVADMASANGKVANR